MGVTRCIWDGVTVGGDGKSSEEGIREAGREGKLGFQINKLVREWKGWMGRSNLRRKGGGAELRKRHSMKGDERRPLLLIRIKRGYKNM